MQKTRGRFRTEHYILAVLDGLFQSLFALCRGPKCVLVDVNPSYRKTNDLESQKSTLAVLRIQTRARFFKVSESTPRKGKMQ